MNRGSQLVIGITFWVQVVLAINSRASGFSESFSEPTDKPTHQILRIHPQPSPLPALRYRLDPEMRNQESGNALPVYYRSFAPDWQAIGTQREWSKKFVEWKDLPLDQLPKEIQSLRAMKYLREIDRAANRSHMDWEMVPSIRRDGANLVIPDVQAFSGFIRLLSLRCRAELMGRDYTAAIGTLRTMITLGRHCDQGPSIIQSLVGGAASDEACVRMQEAISQPGFPNLYWALMAIPEVPIQMRNSMDGEKIIIDSALPGIREMLYSSRCVPLGNQDLLLMLSKFERLVTTINREGEIAKEFNWFKQPLRQDKVAALARDSRNKLRSFGIPEKELAELPDLQLVFMAEVLAYDEKVDEIVRWLNIPFAVSKQYLNEGRVKVKAVEKKGDGVPELGLLGVLSASGFAHSVHAKVGYHRRLAALRVVEAIRLHGAEKGRWPDSLQEMNSVYIPPDPVTGKAFKFRKEQKAIWLESVPLPSEEKNPQMWTWKLELATLQSSGK